MPALRQGGLGVTKLVTVFSGSSVELHSKVVVQDRSGELVAIVAGHELTARRTAAASVLAARTLGAGDARTLAVLGTGRQARAMIAAYVECLPIEEVRIWGRRAEAAQELVEFAQQFAVVGRIAASPADAIADADIVTCATGSRVPLLNGVDVAAGTHIDLVGGFRPIMREADDALMRRAMVVADTSVALEEAGDLTQPIASGAIRASDVLLLGDVLDGSAGCAERRDVTVFKSVGHAAEDLVAVELLLEKLKIPTGARG
jgi:ornithine cyclodeaminase